MVVGGSRGLGRSDCAILPRKFAQTEPNCDLRQDGLEAPCIRNWSGRTDYTAVGRERSRQRQRPFDAGHEGTDAALPIVCTSGLGRTSRLVVLVGRGSAQTLRSRGDVLDGYDIASFQIMRSAISLRTWARTERRYCRPSEAVWFDLHEPGLGSDSAPVLMQARPGHAAS